RTVASARSALAGGYRWVAPQGPSASRLHAPAGNSATRRRSSARIDARAPARLSMGQAGHTRLLCAFLPANWRLGRLRDELDSWGVRYLQAAQEPMSEVDSLAALQGGVAREGWLHYHVQNVTPAEIRNGSFELSVQDPRGRTHRGSAKGPHQVPGRVCPFHSGAARGSPFARWPYHCAPFVQWWRSVPQR